MKTKFDWKGYWSPTPKLFRQIGDTLFTVFGGTGVIEGFAGDGTMASVFFLIAMVGKILTNFFKEDNSGVI